MITIYKKKTIPKNMELVVLNDVYFNKYTAEMLDGRQLKSSKKLTIQRC